MTKPLSFRSASLFAALLLTALAAPRLNAGEPVSQKSPPAKPTEIDVTAVVRAWNAGRYAPPATDFRRGSVGPRELDPKAVEKTKQGFTIKLPSKAPIPTLTVHDHKLFASGGFHSREFYCFAADSGKPIWAVDLDDDGPSCARRGRWRGRLQHGILHLVRVGRQHGKNALVMVPGDPLASTPAVCKGRVFTSYPASAELTKTQRQKDAKQSADGQTTAVQAEFPPTHVLACFDLKSGKLLWQRWIDSDVMTTSVAVENELYVTSLGGAIYRFNQADGAILSVRNVRATSAPVIAGDDIYFTRRADDGPGKKAEEAIVKADRRSANEKFVAARKSAPHLDAVVQASSEFNKKSLELGAGNGIGGGGFGGGGAFAVADDEKGDKDDAKAGAGGDAKATKNGDVADVEPLSPAAANIGLDNVSALQSFQGSRIVNAGGMNFNCMGDQVLCTDAGTGKVAWSLKLDGDLQKEGGYLAAPPAAAGGQIFVATLKGEVLQLEPANGTIVKRYPVGAPLRFQPTIQDGRIYVGTQDGQIVCIDTGDKTFTGWATWGGNAAHTRIREQGKK